jgi:hypothetical protein
VSQTNLFSPPTEEEKRDAALDALEKARANLISVADGIARGLTATHGEVTSVEVFAEMARQGYGPAMKAVDPRWMGAVFRAEKGWTRKGWRQDGSHGRPVAVWTR